MKRNEPTLVQKAIDGSTLTGSQSVNLVVFQLV